MDYINELKALVPDYAKDVRINLDGVAWSFVAPGNEAAAVASQRPMRRGPVASSQSFGARAQPPRPKSTRRLQRPR